MLTKRQKIDMKRIVRIALFIAIALIMYFLESLLPPLLSFAPGSKMGLSNVVSLCALILLGTMDSYIIVVIKCLLSSVFSGNIVAIIYSLPSALISLSFMVVLYNAVFPKISIMCISFMGAVVFNIVQLLVASLVVDNVYLLSLLPLMIGASTIAGIFVGIVAYFIVKYLPTNIYNRQIKDLDFVVEDNIDYS